MGRPWAWFDDLYVVGMTCILWPLYVSYFYDVMSVWLCYVMKFCYDIDVIWCMYFQMLHLVYYVNMFTSCIWDIDKSCVLTIKDMSSIYMHVWYGCHVPRKKGDMNDILSMYHALKLWNLMHLLYVMCMRILHWLWLVQMHTPWYYMCSFPSVASNSVNVR